MSTVATSSTVATESSLWRMWAASSTLKNSVCDVTMSDMMTKTVSLAKLDGPSMVVVAFYS